MFRLFAVMMLTSLSALADSGFEGESGGVRRTGLAIYGGRVDDLAIDGDGTLYAAVNSPNGLFCSTDHGATWTAPPAGSDFGQARSVVTAGVSGRAFFETDGGLYETTDRCASFTTVTGSQGPRFFRPALVWTPGVMMVGVGHPGSPAGIDRSTDDGASFTFVSVGDTATEVLGLAGSPTAGEFWAVVQTGSTNVLMHSFDGGASWTDGGTSGQFRRVAVNPADANEIVLAGQNLVERSVNGGGLFSPITPNGQNREWLSFVDGRLWVGGLWTTDGGTTWHFLDQEATSRTSPLYGPIVQDPSDASTFFVGSARGIAKTTNALADFTDDVEGMLGVNVFGIAQAKEDKNIVYLAAHGGIARTTNYLAGDATTWAYPIDLDGNNDDVNAVLVVDGAGQTVLASAFRNIYRSTDGGATWPQADTSGVTFAEHATVNRFAIAGDGSIYAGWGDSDDPAIGGVLHSTDGGAVWTDAGAPVGYVNAVLVVGDVVYAGIGRDIDRGATHHALLKRSDGTWERVGGALDGQEVNDLAAAGPVVFAAAGDGEPSGGGLFRTEDGVTWNAVGTDVLENARCTRTVAVDPADPTQIYAATGCPGGPAHIYKSEDTGLTWRLLSTGLTDEVPKAMLVDGLIVGQNTGAYQFTELCTLHQIARKSFAASFVETAAGTRITLEFHKQASTRYRAVGRAAKTDASGAVHWTIPKAKRKPAFLFRARSASCTTGERAYEKPARHR